MAEFPRYQILVIGGGLAGLRAAVEAHAAGCSVVVMSKVYPIRSHSGAAQGGINAALRNHPQGKDDSWERHAFDTIKGSDYLADQPCAEILAWDAPERVLEMEHWGTYFSRFADGRIAQRPFGGAGFPRTCYAADRTGRHLLHTPWECCLWTSTLGPLTCRVWAAAGLFPTEGRPVASSGQQRSDHRSGAV